MDFVVSWLSKAETSRMDIINKQPKENIIQKKRATAPQLNSNIQSDS